MQSLERVTSLDRGITPSIEGCSGLPGLPARIPADEDLRRDARDHLLEKRRIGLTVDPELADDRALEGDRNARASRLVRVAGDRSESDVVALDEADPRPDDVGLRHESRYGPAEDVVGVRRF